MSKQRIGYNKRIPLWLAHKGVCPYCGLPVRLLDMEVDHILPELLGTDPTRYASIKSSYDLEETFTLHDYCNWVPAHPGCNHRKGTTVPDRVYALTLIAFAKEKAPLAEWEEARLVQARDVDKAVGKVLAALKKGLLSLEEIHSALAEVPIAVRSGFDPIVMTFGCAVAEALENTQTPEDVPSDYPSLCDWLEADLCRRAAAATSAHFFYPEASARNGETVSVRLAFTGPDLEGLGNADWAWWEILEVVHYSDLYRDDAGK